MTLDQLIAKLTSIRDAYERGGEMPVLAHADGDPSVGIWEYNSEVTDADTWTDEDDRGMPRTTGVVIVLAD